MERAKGSISHGALVTFIPAAIQRKRRRITLSESAHEEQQEHKDAQDGEEGEEETSERGTRKGEEECILLNSL